jgi:sugar/nucleoside kinase (ribokinase family)
MAAACPQADALFVQSLLQGGSLIAALEAATADAAVAVASSSAFDFNLWLPQAAHNGLLQSARLL